MASTAPEAAPARPSHDLSYLAGKHILIAGAGISGLSFPLALHKQWTSSSQHLLPKITIIERDSKLDRLGPRQGYSLSVRSDGSRGGGVQVLDDLGLYEACRDVAVLSDDTDGMEAGMNPPAMCLWEPIGQEKKWKEILRIDVSKMENHTKRKLGGMRIRRNTLQQVLADAAEKLPDIEILWGTAVVDVWRHGEDGFRPDEGEVILTLSNGSKTRCDILLACDGAKSKIRKIVRPDLDTPYNGLEFAECVGITGTAKYDTTEHVPKMFRSHWGLAFDFRSGVSSFISPVDPESLIWSVSYRSRKPVEEMKQPLNRTDGEILLERARELAAFAGSTLIDMVDRTDTDTLMQLNAMDRPPFHHNLSGDGNVIFLGDANHAVSPFAGNGANMALIDSWDLAKAVVQNNALQDTVGAFDVEMLPRCQTVLNESRRNIGVAHAVGWYGWFCWSMVRVLGWWMRLRTS